MGDYLNQFNETTIILISLSAMLLSGFIVTRITKMLKLPNVSGFIIAGMLIGPFGLNIIPFDIISSMSFVGDIALAFIAFDVSGYLKKEIFKANGSKIIIITVMESLIAGVLITLSMRFIFSFDWNLSLLLGTIAMATAPASTMMTINQYKASGEFVNVLLQVIALDDVVCLIAFSVVTAFISGTANGVFSITLIILPILYNIVSLGIGFVLGIILSKLLTPNRSNDNRLILVVGLLLGLSGLCSIFDISPLLACMAFGATYINTTQDKELYVQVHNFTPPILSLFFILSGIKLDINSLYKLGTVGVAYFIIRIVGKYTGAYLGSKVTGLDDKISNYLGLAIIPQAGVAIGLAFLGQRLLPPDVGNRMMTIILASSVLYELIGPTCAKIALIKSGAIENEKISKY